MKVAILGAGKLGIRITEALLDGDYEITLVDTNEDKLNALSQQYDILTVTGDAKTIELLREINVDTYDFLFSTTTSDDTNILAASFAKSLGCPKVAARVRDPEHMMQMDFICQNLNIDMLVNPDILITSEIYRYLIEKYTLSNGIYTSKNIGLIEFEASKYPQIVGKNLIGFREIMPGMIVVAISRGGKIIIPHGNDIIQPHDLLYLMGSKEEIFRLAKVVHGRLRSSDARKVMIIGGGKTGYYLARRLSEYGSHVKLIEKDKKRCHYLAEKLRNVMVLNGDGADISLLEEEDFDSMDAFVTATGYDEENILLALTAKNHGVEDVISKVSHESYSDLISKLDLDMVLNPLDITASAILRAIRGSNRVISAVLLQGQAELLEMYVTEDMGCVNVPLRDFRLPEYIIVAAINRGVETIIPTGETRIKAGDKVVIVCLVSHIGYVEKLFKHASLLSRLK
ncbi:MAG: Trk system potassium transporter TrkA [Mogibacterium sp.]|nr:Trk system potassium transporter TrkA [Mogibacterium sp.]MBR2540664.1 Trk system potassium transporter TrkA [Mogibacterium sp.]